MAGQRKLRALPLQDRHAAAMAGLVLCLIDSQRLIALPHNSSEHVMRCRYQVASRAGDFSARCGSKVVKPSRDCRFRLPALRSSLLVQRTVDSFCCFGGNKAMSLTRMAAAVGFTLWAWSMSIFSASAASVAWQSDAITISVATSSDAVVLDLQATRYSNTGIFPPNARY